MIHLEEALKLQDLLPEHVNLVCGDRVVGSFQSSSICFDRCKIIVQELFRLKAFECQVLNSSCLNGVFWDNKKHELSLGPNFNNVEGLERIIDQILLKTNQLGNVSLL